MLSLQEARQLALKTSALVEEGLRQDRTQEARLSQLTQPLRKFVKIKVKQKPPPRITIDNKNEKFDPRNPVIIRRTP